MNNGVFGAYPMGLLCALLGWASLLSGCAQPAVDTVDVPNTLDPNKELNPTQTNTNPPINTPSTIRVEVQGAVQKPGAYRMDAGDRIQDALIRAGGPLDDAEIRDLNIAARILDGSVLSVPFQTLHGGPQESTAAQLNPAAYTRSGWRSPDTVGGTPGITATPATTRPCIDLNSATQQELETLPGVGPKTAAKILRHRANQPFTSIDDLRAINGIGDQRIATMRPFLCAP